MARRRVGRLGCPAMSMARNAAPPGIGDVEERALEQRLQFLSNAQKRQPSDRGDHIEPVVAHMCLDQSGKAFAPGIWMQAVTTGQKAHHNRAEKRRAAISAAPAGHQRIAAAAYAARPSRRRWWDCRTPDTSARSPRRPPQPPRRSTSLRASARRHASHRLQELTIARDEGGVADLAVTGDHVQRL